MTEKVDNCNTAIYRDSYHSCLILRFSQNPSPPYIFLKLNFRFSKNEIMQYVKNLYILISFCHIYEDPRSGAKEMHKVLSKGLPMIYTRYMGFTTFIYNCVSSQIMYKVL